jgi:hypothetical protein
MVVGRPLMLVVAIMLCMIGTLAPGQAAAHSGKHPASSIDIRQEQPKQIAVASVRDQGLADEMNRQCGAQMCCGSACYSGGYVIAGDSVFPEPVKGGALIPPPPGMTATGIGPAGIKRPPRS